LVKRPFKVWRKCKCGLNGSGFKKILAVFYMQTHTGYDTKRESKQNKSCLKARISEERRCRSLATVLIRRVGSSSGSREVNL
jgi:hypothetical protein